MKNAGTLLDDADRTIITMYARNPATSQEALARELGISQPSVAVRIRKLREMGALVEQVGVDPAKVGLSVVKVDLSTTNKEDILAIFRGCPYFLNGYSVSGRLNLCLFFVSENISTMEAIIDRHLRPHRHVKELEFNIVVSAERPMVVPMVLSHAEKKVAPCGIARQCTTCPSFTEKKCTGCPARGQYKGWLF